MGAQPGDVPAVESDCSGSGRIHPVDEVKESGLSAPIGADDTEDGPFLDFKGKVIDCRHPSKGFYEIMGLEDHVLTI
jgi:hypothetical protein